MRPKLGSSLATALSLLVLAAPACHAFHTPAIRLGPKATAFARTVPLFCKGTAHIARGRAGARGLRAAAGDGVGEMMLDGRILFPGSDGEGWFDAQTTAMPVVLPPDKAAGRQKWLMYYYGVWVWCGVN